MLNKKLPVVGLSWIMVLLLAASGSRAQQLISARVLASEGQVEIQRRPGDQPQARKIAFKVNDELNAGDTIITGRSGRLVLGLSDGSQAVIAPKTTVVIQDLSQSPRTLFQILRGKTRVQIEKLGGQPNPYRINTPTAVIAVRGTIFDVLVEDDETEVFLHEGEVAVTNPSLPDPPVLLLAGQMTRILRLRLPRLPSAFKTGRNDNLFRIDKQIQEIKQTAQRNATVNPGRASRGDSPNQIGRGRGRMEEKSGMGRSGSPSSPASPSGARKSSNAGGGGGRRP